MNEFPAFYAVLDEDRLRMPRAECADRLAGSGVELIQYRAKRASAGNYFRACAALATRLAARKVRFIVNDRADVASMAGAGGVHVGQEDLPAEDAQQICGPRRWVGVSTHTLEQFRAAAKTSADYIAVGPIFETATKGRPDPVVGLSLLRAVRKLTTKPIVAIGGITLERAAEVYESGADCVAVVGDLLESADPGRRAAQFLEVAVRCRRVPRPAAGEIS